MTPEVLNGWEQVGVVGLLIAAIIALWLGYVSPKHVVSDLKTENAEVRSELAAVNEKYVEQVKQNAEMAGQMEAMRSQLERVERELSRLRAKIGEGA